jgi:hypothetical protein
VLIGTDVTATWEDGSDAEEAAVGVVEIGAVVAEVEVPNIGSSESDTKLLGLEWRRLYA